MREEVFSTKTASIHQCDGNELFYLQFGREEIAFKLCDLISFKKKVMNVDLLQLLDSTSPDFEIFNLKHCDRILTLDTFQILEFRDLLSGAFVTLALNSSVKQILRSSL